jgi:peptidoglycan/xylan/chitin deacetylase (PgdA/CDA1 family)
VVDVKLPPNWNRAVKHGLAVAAERTLAAELIRRGHRARGPRVHVFGYHRVVPDVPAAARTCIGPLCVSTRAFAAHLDHLARRYVVWPLDDALDLLEGTRPAPARDVAVITFDDGYRDVLLHAAPILAARGLPATVYATTSALSYATPMPHDRLFGLVRRARQARVRLLGHAVSDELQWPLARADQALEDGDAIGATDALLGALPMHHLQQLCAVLSERFGEPDPEELAPLLEWDDLEELADLGFEIGAHGATHTHLPLEDDETLIEELAGPRAEIARRLGIPPSTFSYPAGRYDERTISATRAAGYRAALTTEDRRNHPGDDPFRLGRKILCEEHGIGVGGRAVPAILAAQLDGLFSTLGLTRAVPGDRGLDAPFI